MRLRVFTALAVLAGALAMFAPAAPASASTSVASITLSLPYVDTTHRNVAAVFTAGQGTVCVRLMTAQTPPGGDAAIFAYNAVGPAAFIITDRVAGTTSLCRSLLGLNRATAIVSAYDNRGATARWTSVRGTWKLDYIDNVPGNPPASRPR